ncbi:MAG: LysR family transcriptional regulator [Deltaproteobacteria bacterium]|nr:LysR family transcriptional regulator [Deltaproteobacteria bacterium]
MEIRQLKTFRTVAQLLSFNQAAKQLHYAQSSISAQIQGLEEELGVQLFDRLGRRILLTEAGVSLLNYAEKILDLADETRSEVAGERELKGSLTIRIPETLSVHRLPLVIKQFRSRFPKVRLRFTSCTHEGLQKDLRKGITDLAFLLTESFHAADLEAEVLGIETLVLVTHPNHPLVNQPVVRTRDLEGETLLFSKFDCSYRRTLEGVLNTEKVRYDTTIEFNGVEAIKQCVMAGVGVTILPEITVAADISQGRLAALSWAEGQLEVATLMIWYKDRWLSPTLSAFMEAVREVLKKGYKMA